MNKTDLVEIANKHDLAALAAHFGSGGGGGAGIGTGTAPRDDDPWAEVTQPGAEDPQNA